MFTRTVIISFFCATNPLFLSILYQKQNENSRKQLPYCASVIAKH